MDANTIARALAGACMLAIAASTAAAGPGQVAADFRVLPESIGIRIAGSGFSGTTIERTLGSGPAEAVEVPRGATIRLVLHAPEGTEFHLHGYDAEATADSGEPAVMTFQADRTGRFPVEAHGVEDALGRSDRVLLYIEVLPE